MRRTVKVVAAGLGLCWAAAAQKELPPGTLLLARVTAHMRDELARLPNCSCLETVHREHRYPNAPMLPLDTVRMEVLYSNRREFYASPGDRRFGDDQPIDFVGSGTMGNGHFALLMAEISSEHGLSYLYKGEELLGARRLSRFDYRVPLSISGHTISLPGVAGKVGMKGSFWVDPASYDVVRLAMEAVEIPPELPVSSSATSVDFTHTSLGGADFLLPQSADFRLVRFSGEESRNHIEFTHCRLYGAESTVSFGSGQGFPQFGASRVLETGRELLPELKVAVSLSTGITEMTAVGTLIEGKVEGSVVRKGKVLIPGGSPVRGRVRRLEHYQEKGGYYIVGIEFTEMEAAGTRYRFFADLEGTDALPGLSQAIRTRKAPEKSPSRGDGVTVFSEEILSLPDLPGVGTFFVQAPRLNIPAGFHTAWKTRALVP